MIPIKNIYHMLTYAFRALNKGVHQKIASEEFEHTADLLASILIKGINGQNRHGLGKDYVKTTETLRSPKGKINVTQSIKQQTLVNKKLVCQFDVYTENSYMNQILKTTVLLLLKTNDVSQKNKKDLRKILSYFSNVGQLNHHRIKWSNLTYTRNNITYKMLMNICYFIIDGLLLTNQDGSIKMANFEDDQKFHQLFERFVLEYYRKHFPEYQPRAAYIDWIADGANEFLPTMQSDVVLQNNGKKLIIDTKYYSKTMQSHFNSRSYHSQNMYQIFTYVKNEDRDKMGNISGLLLYVKTDEEVVPDNEFMVDGNLIGVKTLDLNTDFEYIKEQLNGIADYFLLGNIQHTIS